MNEPKRSPRAWLDVATAGIRFGPDRAEARAELEAHMEDKAADFRRIFPDMGADEAWERAASEMGDPMEVSRELAKIHRPWLGYLWKFSRRLVQIMACVVVLNLVARSNPLQVPQELWYYGVQNWENRVSSQMLYGNRPPDWEGERLALYDFDEETRLGRCTLSIDRGALWREKDGNTLYVDLRLDFDRPWEAGGSALFYIWAEDDLGNRYMEGDGVYTHRGTVGSGLRRREVNLSLDGVPDEAKRIRFHYGLTGTALDLTLDLTKEARP